MISLFSSGGMPRDRKRLVIIGNGMAGARLAEDVIAADPNHDFEIVMFGDEPYGNYNRILLSNVLNGAQDAKEIFLNSLSCFGLNHLKFTEQTMTSFTWPAGKRAAVQFIFCSA